MDSIDYGTTRHTYCMCQKHHYTSVSCVCLSRIIHQQHLVKHHNDCFSGSKSDLLSDTVGDLLLSGISEVE